MSRKDEVKPNVYTIPKNSFDSGYVLGGQFKTRNFVEAVIAALPFLGIFVFGWMNLGWNIQKTVSICFIVCGGVFIGVVQGVGGDSLLEFLIRVFRFRKNRRISKYNPRIKTELEPDYLIRNGRKLPREQLMEVLDSVKSKVVGGEGGPISADITDDGLKVYYEDDENFVEKPDELKTKAELKAEAKQRAKEEKEYIKSLPPSERRAAKAELKRKHKEEAEAIKKKREEEERIINESIQKRLNKAERVKAAQYRAHLDAEFAKGLVPDYSHTEETDEPKVDPSVNLEDILDDNVETLSETDIELDETMLDTSDEITVELEDAVENTSNEAPSRQEIADSAGNGVRGDNNTYSAKPGREHISINDITIFE